MSGMSQIVKVAARLLAGFALVFGAYLVCYGHLTPGGGLAGGLLIASCFMLLVLALGRREGACGLEDAAHLFSPLGMVLFLMVGCLGLGAMFFFKNYGFPATAPGEQSLLSGGTVLLSNLALLLSLWMGFLVAFLALAGFRRSGDGGGDS